MLLHVKPIAVSVAISDSVIGEDIVWMGDPESTWSHIRVK